MKRQWKIQRTVKEQPDGQRRWDQAYRLILEMTSSCETNQKPASPEVSDASSPLCTGVDPAPSPRPND